MAIRRRANRGRAADPADEAERVEAWIEEAGRREPGGSAAVVSARRRSSPALLVEPPRDSEGIDARGLRTGHLRLRLSTTSTKRSRAPIRCRLRFRRAFHARPSDCFQAAERLDASAVMVNDHTAFRTDWMPFAGRRQSGYGVGGIPWTMEEMADDKMVVFNQVTTAATGAARIDPRF